MKRILSTVLFLLTLSFFVACGESSKEKAQRKVIDSLENENALGRMDYADLQDYLSIIASGLDSIAIEERELLVITTPGENMGLNRQRIKQNLNHVREILARHRARIQELEARLDSGTVQARQLRTIIVALRQQIESKDKELLKLKADLEDNRQNIAQLRSQVQQISEENEVQAQTIQEQQETIDTQTEMMNKAYVRMASKKELKESGLLTGGFLKKTKIDYSKIDLNRFQTVDIRTFKTINLPRKSKILSQVPEGSYTIEKSSDREILHIIDSEKFWSVSRYLIIQTN